MDQAITAITPIRSAPQPLNVAPDPLTTIIHNAGRKLLGLQMTRLVGEADKSDAQALTRDLLDIAKIVDDALLEIGREAKAHFGSHIDVSLFTDQLLGAIQGNATFNVCEAIEVREEDFEAEIGDTRYKLARDYAA